jgi:hypothetical protein
MESVADTPVRVELVDSLDSCINEIRDSVAKHAYEKYLARGAEQGRELEDWLSAEREMFVKATVFAPRIENDEIVFEIVVPQVELQSLRVLVAPNGMVLLGDSLEPGRRIVETSRFPKGVVFERTEAEYVIDTLFVIAPIQSEREHCEAA